MKKILLLIICSLLISCGKNETTAQNTGPSNALPSAEVATPTHYYSMKDGYSYGYERAVSDTDAHSGVVASPLLMFRYSGIKDGIYQVYIKDDSIGVITAFQCANPCEFIKVISVARGGASPQIEHLKFTPGTIAWSVLSDAFSGKLDQVIVKTKGKDNKIWITEDGNLLQSEL